MTKTSAEQTVKMPCSTTKTAHTDKENLHIVGKSKKFSSRISGKSFEQNGFRTMLKYDHNTLEHDMLMTSLAILKVTFEPTTVQKIQQLMDKGQLRKCISKCAVTSEFFSDLYCLSPVFTIVPSGKFNFSSYSHFSQQLKAFTYYRVPV